MVTFADIERAEAALTPVVHRTPLLTSRTFDLQTGNQVSFKAENLQRVGAFKIRGAYNKISSLTEAERSRGVVAHSSGNHAQGVALASKLFGTKATIVMPVDSVAGKVRAARGYGADVVFCGTESGDRERATEELISKFGYVLVHPYNDEKLIAGQGTVALEIFRDVRELDYLFVPVGGGGLISGCAIAAKHMCPSVRVIGVETEGADDCRRSFQQKKIVRRDVIDTIADGIRTRSVGELNFEIIMRHVDDVITIRDEDIYPMMRFFVERMKIVVEPTGAVAPAAVLKNEMKLSGKKIGAVISGGNVDPSLLRELFSGHGGA